jgi:TonB family protein
MSGLAEDEFERPAWVIWVRRGGVALVLLALVAGVVLLGRQMMKQTTTPQRQMARIAIVPNTPPPPPPPPKEEKKLDQKETPKQADIDRPKPVAQMPDEQIKMEGQGSDTGLAGIGAGKVTSDYVGQKIGGGGGDGAGSRFAWYKLVVQQMVQAALQKNTKLRSTNYRVIVKIWLGPDGVVSRAELSDTTGNADMDQRLRTALSQLPPFGERPPEGLPQPITMRLTTRS